MKRNNLILFITIICSVFLVSIFSLNTKASSKIKNESSGECLLEEMLKTHPYPPVIEMKKLLSGIKAINGCAKISTICADACVGEKNLMLTRCIRSCLDCADICGTTAKILSRQTETDIDMLRDQLKACAVACNKCGQDCEKHAMMYEHCRICADVCFSCEETCNDLLEELKAL